MKKGLLANAIAAFSLLGVSAASASIVDVETINALMTPWSVAANPGMSYGVIGDESVGPTVVSVAGDVSASFSYVGGTIAEYVFHPSLSSLAGITPVGVSSDPYGSGNAPTTLRPTGSTGQLMPSSYIEPGNVGPDIYFGALLASFADSSGQVIGAPFAPGDSDANVMVPDGATELLLGVNQDYFGSIMTSGSWTYDVTLIQGSVGGGVPEAPTCLMALLGMLALGTLGARRARA